MSIIQPPNDDDTATPVPESPYKRERSLAARLRSLEQTRAARAASLRWPSLSDGPTEQQSKLFVQVEDDLRRMVDAQFKSAAGDVAIPPGQGEAGEAAATAAPAAQPPASEPKRRLSHYLKPAARPREAGDDANVLPVFSTPPGTPNLAADPEEWLPREKPKPSRMSVLLTRLGLAAGGAALVLVFAAPDVRSFFLETVGGKLTPRPSNAAVVIRDQKPAAEAPWPAANSVAVRHIAITRSDALKSEAPRADAPKANAPNADALKSEPLKSEPPKSDAQARATVGKGSATIQHAIASQPAPRPQTDLAPPAPVRVLSAEDIALLRKQGDDYVAAGDFAGARVVLQRAAEAGDAAAALSLAATFDPVVLSRNGVRGLAPDSAKAAYWYERARALGLANAPRHLNALARGD